MQLTDEQKQQVAVWVREGAGLADVQKRLAAELGITLTYMDVRFLVIDLGLEVKNKVTKVAAPAPAMPPPPADDAEAEPFADDEPPSPLAPPGGAAAGSVRVELDRVMKPGSLASGTVTFSDGVTAAWSLDQFGRLALVPPRPGYQPAPSDIQAFQLELRRALERRGY